jgi:hypothetical protein
MPGSIFTYKPPCELWIAGPGFPDPSRGRQAMSVSLIPLEQPSPEPLFALSQAQARLRQTVWDSVQSIHSKRNYAKALDDLFTFCASRPLSRELLMEYRTTMDHLSPSTINVRLSAIRKLVGEARRNGIIGREEADNLTDVPNVRQKGLVSGTGLPANRRRSCWRCLIGRHSKASATT